MKLRIQIAVMMTAIVQLVSISAVSAESAKFLWAHNAGSGYINGKTYHESRAYCRSTGGELATKDQLIEANKDGFSMCAQGWLDGGISGYVMSGTRAGCGRHGFNGGTRPSSPNKKLGAYCVGRSAPAGVQSVQLSGARHSGTGQSSGQSPARGSNTATADRNQIKRLEAEIKQLRTAQNNSERDLRSLNIELNNALALVTQMKRDFDSILSVTGDTVTVRGQNIIVKALNKLELKGTTLELDGTAKVNLTGALINLGSSRTGMLNLNGKAIHIGRPPYRPAVVSTQIPVQLNSSSGPATGTVFLPGVPSVQIGR